MGAKSKAIALLNREVCVYRGGQEGSKGSKKGLLRGLQKSKP